MTVVAAAAAAAERHRETEVFPSVADSKTDAAVEETFVVVAVDLVGVAWTAVAAVTVVVVLVAVSVVADWFESSVLLAAVFQVGLPHLLVV